MDDRRRFPRIESTYQVKYYPSNSESQFSYTITSDISKGGMCMPVRSDIAKPGEVIQLAINRKDGKGRIMATGKVRWASMLKRKAILDAKVGIEFINIADSDVESLLGVN